MNGTPRLRSAFPSSPQANANKSPSRSDATPNRPTVSPSSPRLPDIGSLLPSKPQPNAPLISFDIIDAPSQRLYVVGSWLLLFLWRLYDYHSLTVDETESLWQFMKWVAIDIASLCLLEAMRIPWLELTPTTQLVVFSMHVLLDGFLMFRIPIPFNALLIALVRLLYDRELTMSGNYVKPGDVIHNPSLILGRQIIHVLPEGSAVLNPDKLPLCLDASKFSPSVTIPLRINQTNPLSIELVRFDLDTPENETIIISSSQAKRLRKDAVKGQSLNPSDPVTLQYPVKKTGLYRLRRVVDETKLEVHGASEALVVSCPTARINYLDSNRCPGDLSDLSLEVTGTPPLKVKYTKTTAHAGQQAREQTLSYQSIQPDDFVSPLIRQQSVGTLTSKESFDISWARSYVIKVPLNESLDFAGRLTYSIEEIIDGKNNSVKYAADDDSENKKSKHSDARLLVHDRPKASLQGLGPFNVRKGNEVEFPLNLASVGQNVPADTEYALKYTFTPVDMISSTGDHSPDAEVKELIIKSINSRPRVRDAGLYSLLSVSSPYCPGDILEPRSFMLVNPPEPDLSIVTEEISDKCAGNPIGFRVGLDLVGTPPFQIRFEVKSGNEKAPMDHVAQGLRGTIELTPPNAGHYTYTFLSISDAVYQKPISLQSKNLVLEQDVKPSVSATLLAGRQGPRLCIDDAAKFNVKFQGEPPWTLEYELVHSGKRTKQAISDIMDEVHSIDTGPLTNGGEYTLALISVTDRLGCKEALQGDTKIFVRHQRPKVSFGSIEGKYTVRALEGKSQNIPLRLAGEPPWTVKYEYVDGDVVEQKTKPIKHPNDNIQAAKRGLYRITDVHDSVCPGVVEHSGEFEISWIPRPEVSVPQSPLLEQSNGVQDRAPVCEGEQDAVDILFNGRPPFEVQYETRIMLDSGSKGIKNSEDLRVALNSAQIPMDTTRAGTYEYTVTKLGDGNYGHDSKRHNPLTIRQRVHARPSASFASTGKVYSFCQSHEEDADSEVLESIPMTLVGHPPFTVDFELKRHGRSSARAEPLTFSNIESNQYNARIPSRYLQPGNSALTIRRVRDSRGCERIYDPSAPATSASSASSSSSGAGLAAPRVQISVHDLPTIVAADDRTHYCVGERIAFSLSGGSPPYTIFYTFGGRERKATESSAVFRRLAEAPGEFTITAINDASSTCKRSLQQQSDQMRKVIHALPSARVSQGKESRVDIHAGGEAEIHFEFGGIPPFEFTYIRSENAGDRHGRGSGRGGQVLETKTLASEDPTMSIKARDEGTYEVVAIRDRYCSFAREGYAGFSSSRLLKES